MKVETLDKMSADHCVKQRGAPIQYICGAANDKINEMSLNYYDREKIEVYILHTTQKNGDDEDFAWKLFRVIVPKKVQSI